ncbi:MAG: hypothetical protein WAL95_11390 [Candidatus Acidiferrales bacterium]
MNSPSQATALASKLYEQVSVELDPKESFKEWTRVHYKAFEKLGRESGFEICRSGTGGYLLDLIWYSQSSHEIALGLEMEWGTETSTELVSYDFEKLLHIKAPLKVMIFQTRNHDVQSAPIRRKLETEYMAKFSKHMSKEQYLLVEFTAPWNKAYCYELIIESDGRLNSPIFKEIEGLRFEWDFLPRS